MHLARSALLALLALALAGPARATWSIVLFNRVTGECGVAVTSCIPGNAVGFYVPVLVVGQGAAAAQALVDNSGLARIRIRDGILAGENPTQILAALGQTVSLPTLRQYGIACAGGPPAGSTGAQTFAAALHRAGSVGDWDYSVQGNILAGDPVVLEAEQALLRTAAFGDATQILMAALEGGRLYGGDGRCSCSPSAPTSCGSPPATFTHTATSAWIGVARPGDVDGSCSVSGCANGSYYLRREFNQGGAARDPVQELVARLRLFRAGERGRPDHFKSEVTSTATVLQADGGLSRATVHVRLVDLDGVPLSTGGAALTVAASGGAIGALGPVVDFGDGTYAFDVTSTALAGEARYTITVDDGAGRSVQLWPEVPLRSVAPRELHATVDVYSAAVGTRIPFVLRRGAADAGRPYRLLATTAGTQPGTVLGQTLVPLNRDRLFDATLAGAGPAPYTNFIGTLDGAGEAAAALEYPPGTLAPLFGATLYFAAVVDATDVTNVVQVQVVP